MRYTVLRSLSFVLCACIISGTVFADGACIMDVGSNSTEVTSPYVFPNWTKAHVTSFDVYVCLDIDCPTLTTETFRGLTIQNFGTATQADITDLYWRVVCAKSDTGLVTMTYAGNWNGFPAWTWAGTSMELFACQAGSIFQLRVYADIDDCPAENSTLVLGVPADVWYRGGLTDNNGCAGPWTDTLDAMPKTVAYVVKTRDVKIVAPGDTINYTIWYGRPGMNPLDNIIVTDTLPQYTHYILGSGTPAPDAAWDPDPGPPPRLRWTFNGPLNPGGGPTGEIRYQVSVDWGNKEWFEPGSGDVAAPEGARLENTAHVSYYNTSCAMKASTSGKVVTTVRRYLFWEIGDNDVLFAGRVGMPDDEITYAIFIRNESASRTWWNVSVWDTVPAEIDVWENGYGHDDPCVGWTMTPTGCASASAGKVVTGAKSTILTWFLDLPPGGTMELRWKGRVNPQTAPFSTAISRASIMAWGNSGVIDGTGHANQPRNFVHVAPIVLRTVYVSYMGVGGGGLGQSGISLVFFPLNKAGDFELRGLELEVATSTFPVYGGVSGTINTLIGTCLTGMVCAGSNGCGAERAPAFYAKFTAGCYPDSGSGQPASSPYHLLYKLTSNHPVLWMMFSELHSDDHDAHTFTPSTSLHYSGFVHYTYLRDNSSANRGDCLNVINTSIDSFATYSAALATTIHVFKWDAGQRLYLYQRTEELGPEGQWAKPPIIDTNDEGFFKVISSDSRLLVRQSSMAFGIIQGGAYNNYSTISPTRETGYLVSSASGHTFYIFPGGGGQSMDNTLTVGTPGTTAVTYRIERYVPDEPFDRPATVPMWMGGTSGRWDFVKRDTVDPGMDPGAAVTGNPHTYGFAYDPTVMFRTPDGTGGVWRVIQESAGSLSMNSGKRVMSTYSGGCLVHAADGNPLGKEFWIHSSFNWCMSGSHCDAPIIGSTYAIDLFCPKPGMQVRMNTYDGYSATYSTTGPDQCIAFMGLTDVLLGSKRNYRAQLLAAGAQGNMICMYNHCQPSHKFFTAPFLVTGVHYDIIAPPAVYVGQNFWITVIVVEAGGETKADYCGTTSFTSTDPTAKLEGAGMDTYNYTWDSDDVGALCKGAGCPNGCDNGVKIFYNVTFTKLGRHTLVAADIMDGSIIGITSINVIGVDVKLWKEPRLSVLASGDTQRFRICWSNYSSASAFSFIITDAVPRGTDYVPDTATNHVCGTTSPVTLDLAYSTATSSTPPATFTTTTGTPLAATRWLRWSIREIGIAMTGCACFQVKVQ